MLEQVLPIGTVVVLKGANKRIMIFGYQKSPNESLDKIYDYIGCSYPEGFIGAEYMFMFDHSDIEHIFALGLQNEEQINFRKDLENELDRMNLRKKA